MINNLRKNKGITLIALVITIIVLLILAGVTINTIVGNENAMEKAKEAREKTYEAQEKEQIILNQINSQFEPEWDGTVANSFAKGIGSESDPYIIENGSQLAYLAAAVNGEKEPPTGTTVTFEGKFISIVKSINLGNKEFTPIGIGNINSLTNEDTNTWTTNKKFQGKLDGKNNVITGININQPTISGVGIIGVLETGGEVKNLVINEGTIVGLKNVGGIVGASRGNIINCQNSAKVEARSNSTANTGDQVGGIVGLSSNGKIENCKNYGAVKANNVANSVSSGKLAGGIAGLVKYNKTNETININNCINYGEVIATYQQAGGIVGQMAAGTVSKCYNTGSVEAKSVGRMIGIAGGIIGSQVGGTISEVYNAGNVTIKTSNVANKVSAGGGIIGFCSAGSIEKAYNKGEILGDGEAKGGVVGKKTEGTLSKTYFYKLSDSTLNGIGTTSGNTMPLTPVEQIENEVEGTTVIYNSLDAFLKAIR